MAFVFLRRTRTFVVLVDRPHPRLYWLSADGKTAGFSVAVAGIRPCFKADALGSDAIDRVFLAGTDGSEFGGLGHVVSFDAEGSPLGDVPLDCAGWPGDGNHGKPQEPAGHGARGSCNSMLPTPYPRGRGPCNARC